MFNRTLPVTCLILALVAVARGQEKSMDEQYQALAKSRTTAELAIRKTRQFFEENGPKVQQINYATDAAASRAREAFQKAITDEQRKPEDQRNQAVMEDLNQRRVQMEQDWQRFSSVERAGLGAGYGGSSSTLSSVSQVFSQLTQLEPYWKDSKIDLATLQGAYEALAKRVDELKAAAERSIANLQEAQKRWEDVAAGVTKGK